VHYYLNGIRGFWGGFLKGFYKDTKLELTDRCINTQLTSNIQFLIKFAEGKEPLYRLPKFTITVAKIFNDNFSYCGYDKFANDLKTFCQEDTCD
jgi:hypothetical protein